MSCILAGQPPRKEWGGFVRGSPAPMTAAGEELSPVVDRLIVHPGQHRGCISRALRFRLQHIAMHQPKLGVTPWRRRWPGWRCGWRGPAGSAPCPRGIPSTMVNAGCCPVSLSVWRTHFRSLALETPRSEGTRRVSFPRSWTTGRLGRATE